MAKRKIWTVGELIAELKKHADKRGMDEPVCIVYPRMGEFGPLPDGRFPVGHVRFRREMYGLQIVTYVRY